MTDTITPWREVEPLADMNGELRNILVDVDSMRAAWEDALARISPAEFASARERSLRRHAIETGIIERLYDVDWGVTHALVAEGLTAEVAAREGGINNDALSLIRGQFEALEFLAIWAGEDRELSISFIRQMHVLITQHQPTYEARNSLGHLFQAPLHHGEWKQQPNHVYRQDGTLLQYTPPEQVQPQMERLVDLYGKTANAHPLIRAAWLHHRFICIHPFEDGNGRVARALTLLALLQSHYAPLVVDRSQREEYLGSLDAANDGDLRRLVQLFAKLEKKALVSELEPAPAPAAGTAVEVAKAYATRLLALQSRDTAAKTQAAERLAAQLHSRLIAHVETVGAELREAFRDVDPDAWFNVKHAAPPDPEAKYWHGQLVFAAKHVDFYANLSRGSWWVRLHLTILGRTLRFLTAIQKVGQGETGVLAQTVFAEVLGSREAEGEQPTGWDRAFEPSSTDSVTFVYTDRVDERWPEVTDLIERGLTAAVNHFGSQLG